MSQRPNNSSQNILYQTLLQRLWVQYCIKFEELSYSRFPSWEAYNYECHKLWQFFQKENYKLWHNCHNSWNFPKEKPICPIQIMGFKPKKNSLCN